MPEIKDDWNNIDYVKHILQDCDSLKNIRRRYKIKGDIDYILSIKENNVENLIKFLHRIFNM